MVCDYMLKTHSVTVEHKQSYRCILHICFIWICISWWRDWGPFLRQWLVPFIRLQPQKFLNFSISMISIVWKIVQSGRRDHIKALHSKENYILNLLHVIITVHIIVNGTYTTAITYTSQQLHIIYYTWHCKRNALHRSTYCSQTW